MEFSDVLDTTFSLYRTRFRLFLGISAVCFFSHIALSAFTHWVIDWCELALLALVYGGIVFASAQTYLGKRITLLAVFRQVIRRFFPYLGATLLWLFFVGISTFGVSVFIFLVTPQHYFYRIFASIIGLLVGICVGMRWCFYGQVVLIEETSLRRAMKRSSELVAGAWGRVCSLIVVIFFLILTIQSILLISFVLILPLVGIDIREADVVELIQSVVWDEHESPYHLLHIISTAIEALTVPIMGIAITLLYFDQRIRKEAFDLEMRVTNNLT